MIYQYNPNIYIGNLNKDTVNDAIDHAVNMFPNESCGAIIDNKYISFKNESETPESSFQIKDDLWFTYYINDKIDCIVHSHNDCNRASLVDQQQQQELCIPSLIINLKDNLLCDCIVFGENSIAPLDARPFFYGAFDCFSLVRDFLKLKYSVEIPNPPHKWEFWAYGDDVVERTLNDTSLPFIDVGLPKSYELGDVLLYKHGGTKHINHMGVYCDNGMVFHHVLNNISGKYPIMFMRKYLYKVMRLI